MRVALVAPVRPRCGIADYTRALLPWLRGHTRVELIPSDDGTGRVDYRALGERVNAADVGHVQYEHGFFLQDDDPAGNFDVFMQAVRVPVLITLHCLPLDDPRWVRHLHAPQVGCLVHSRHHEAAVRAHEVVLKMSTVSGDAAVFGPGAPWAMPPSSWRDCRLATVA